MLLEDVMVSLRVISAQTAPLTTVMGALRSSIPPLMVKVPDFCS